MTTWAIGDLQGCYDTTQRLLEKLRFDPAVDRLWFCGDLVNRGGQSLETLRLVHSLRECSEMVLGNHDLSLLAIGVRTPEEQRKVNPDLQRIVLAEDRDELLDWLRLQKLVHVDRGLGWMMVHAGLAPGWTTQQAETHAREVETRLHGVNYRKLLRSMYGDQPTWNPKLNGPDRDRAIINLFTRMRYCTPRGRIAYEEKGMPGTQAQGLYPWFDVPGRAERDLKIVCGHWSTMGLMLGFGVHAIDTGAVWGGKLTALQLDGDELRVVQVPGRDVPPPVPRTKTAARPADGREGERRGHASGRGPQGGGNRGGAGSEANSPRRDGASRGRGRDRGGRAADGGCAPAGVAALAALAAHRDTPDTPGDAADQAPMPLAPGDALPSSATSGDSGTS